MTTIAHIDKNRIVLGVHDLATAPAAVLSSNVVVDKAKDTSDHRDPEQREMRTNK